METFISMMESTKEVPDQWLHKSGEILNKNISCKGRSIQVTLVENYEGDLKGIIILYIQPVCHLCSIWCFGDHEI